MLIKKFQKYRHSHNIDWISIKCNTLAYYLKYFWPTWLYYSIFLEYYPNTIWMLHEPGKHIRFKFVPSGAVFPHLWAVQGGRCNNIPSHRLKCTRNDRWRRIHDTWSFKISFYFTYFWDLFYVEYLQYSKWK